MNEPIGEKRDCPRDCRRDGHYYQLLRSERVEVGWHRHALRDTFYCVHCLRYQREEHPVEEWHP